MATNNTTKTGASAYTFMSIRKDNEEPYVGMVTGFTLKSKDPVLHPEKDGKKEWVESSININDSVAAVFARAEGTYQQGAAYDENTFLTLAAFQGLGKRVMDIAKSTRVAVSGRITKSEYNKQDGTPAASYRLLADSVQILGDGASLNRFCAVQTQVYDGKQYPKVSGLMAEVTKVGQLGSDKNSRAYVFVQAKIALDARELMDRAFGTWSKDKSYYKDSTITLVYNGKAAETRMDPNSPNCLKVGQLLCVSGTVDKNDYQGKTYCRVRVNRSLIAKNVDEGAAPTTNGASAAAATENEEPAVPAANKGKGRKKAAASAPAPEPDVPNTATAAESFADLGSEDEEDLPF